MKNKISVTILTKNSEKYLSECLSALVDFDEVIILDNGSNDRTMDIARTFKNTVIHEHDFIGFGPLKQMAVSFSKNDWILSVDSDEVFTEKLVSEIMSLELNDTLIYSILRDNYYNKKLVKCCGWGNDYVHRLFNKQQTNFNNKQVHESVEVLGNMQLSKLDNTFKHYSFDSAAELLVKMDKYSTLYAQENNNIKSSSPFKAFAKACFAFFKNYILQKGCLYGYEGLVISVSNANGVFYKYAKLFEENKK